MLFESLLPCHTTKGSPFSSTTLETFEKSFFTNPVPSYSLTSSDSGSSLYYNTPFSPGENLGSLDNLFSAATVPLVP